MDGERFDAMAKALAAGPTRRRFLLGLLGGGLGLLGLLGPEDAGAHDALRACRKIEDRKRRRRCIRRARQHNLAHQPAGTCTATTEDVCQELDYVAANCNNTRGCSCTTTTAGTRFCGEDLSSFCAPGGDCQTDADCGGGGAVCAKKLAACGGCPNNFCIGPCGAASLGASGLESTPDDAAGVGAGRR